MSLHKLFGILLARWLPALGVLVAVVGLALLVSVVAKRSYTASASVVVDFKSNDPIGGVTQSGVAVSTYMTTQMDVVASERVVSRAVESLKLEEDRELLEQWHRSTDGVGDLRTWLSDLVRSRVDVRPSRDSNVLNIACSWTDPRSAADLANAIVRAYTDIALELRIEPARQYNAFFDERSKKLREDYERAQARLSAYERDNGLLNGSDRIDVESARLAQLNSQVVELQVAVAESESKSGRGRTRLDSTPEVLANPVVGGIKAELARQGAEIQQLHEKYGDEFPRVKELTASIADLTQRMNDETLKVRGGVVGSNEVNQRRLLIVRQLLDEQREKVMKLKTQRDEAAVLQRDVQNAERTYDTILARLQQSSLESQNTQTNVSILTEAKPPLAPSSPKVALNLMLGIVAGSILAIATALACEAVDPRIRSVDDVIDVIDLPLIVDLAAASRTRKGVLPAVLALLRQPQTAGRSALQVTR